MRGRGQIGWQLNFEFFSQVFSRDLSLFELIKNGSFEKINTAGALERFFIEKGELYRTRDFTSVTSLDFEPCLISLSLIEVGHNSGVGPRVT